MEPSSYGPFPNLPITRRKHFAWPDGNHLALWVVPNLEYFRLDAPLPGIHNERVPRTVARIPNVRSWARQASICSSVPAVIRRPSPQPAYNM